MRVDALSSQQAEAVHHREQRLVVRAAAGSGKTRVLAARYVRLVEEGLSPEQILTITFTRKAAAQMKRRIVDSLRSIGKSREAQLAETGPIQTIHSFCERTLREHAVSAGLDPDFEILSEREAARLLEESKQRILAGGPVTDFERKALKTLAGARKQRSAAVHGEFQNLIDSVLKSFRGTLHKPEDLLMAASSAEALREQWHTYVLETIGAPANEVRPLAGSSDFWRLLAEAKKNGRWADPWPIPTASKALAADADESELAALTCGIVSLGCRIWIDFETVLTESQRPDFTLLERWAVELIDSDTYVLSQIRGQFKAVLVDESQDLNPVQDKLLRDLDFEHELIVGDVRQSIYGFRQADPELFAKRQETTLVSDLSTNYRSCPAILAAVDRVFAGRWPGYVSMEPAETCAQEGMVELWRAKRDSPTVLDWTADVIRRHGPENVAVLVRYGYEVSQVADGLTLRGIPVREIGSNRTFFQLLAIRDVAVAIEGLFQPEVDFSVLSMLRGPLAMISLDSLAKLAKLQSVGETISTFTPIHPDEHRRIQAFLGFRERIRPELDRMTAQDFLRELLNESPFMDNLARGPYGKRAVANVRKLVLVAAGMRHLTPLEFAGEIRQIQELPVRESEAMAFDEREGLATVMTVHQAKGLEFPVVILPKTAGRLSRDAGTFEFDRAHGIIAAHLTGKQGAMRDFLADRRKRREEEEELRLLYVAMTRAQEGLYMVVAPARLASARSWGSLLLEKLAARSPGFEPLSVHVDPLWEEPSDQL